MNSPEVRHFKASPLQRPQLLEQRSQTLTTDIKPSWTIPYGGDTMCEFIDFRRSQKCHFRKFP